MYKIYILLYFCIDPSRPVNDRPIAHISPQVVTWQIVAGLAGAVSFRSGLAYPAPFRDFASAIEVFLMDVFTFFHSECVARTTYADKLMVSLLTLVVLGLIALFIGYARKMIWGGTVLRSWSVESYIVLIYDVLPVMSSMAFSAFNVDRVSEEPHHTQKSFVPSHNESRPPHSSTHHPSPATYPVSTIAAKIVARRT